MFDFVEREGEVERCTHVQHMWHASSQHTIALTAHPAMSAQVDSDLHPESISSSLAVEPLFVGVLRKLGGETQKHLSGSSRGSQCLRVLPRRPRHHGGGAGSRVGQRVQAPRTAPPCHTGSERAAGGVREKRPTEKGRTDETKGATELQ